MINHNMNLKSRLIELLMSVCVSIIRLKISSFGIKSHNGVSIFDYPESSWSMVPFPKQKGNIFNADNLATVNRHSFLNSEKFIKAKDSAERRWGKPNEVRDISWRLHVLLWAYGLALKNSRSEASIFVECGTGRGYMAAAACDYYASDVKAPQLYLIDTFSSHLVLNSGRSVSSPAHFAYSDGDEEVKSYFSQYPNVNIVKGLIPDALIKLPLLPISFLHVDLNNASAEGAALNYLKERFTPGAVIIFDDYGGPGGDEQALVHEQFAKSVNRQLLILPTGQAILIW